MKKTQADNSIVTQRVKIINGEEVKLDKIYFLTDNAWPRRVRRKKVSNKFYKPSKINGDKVIKLIKHYFNISI
jgi:hypothetical protein